MTPPGFLILDSGPESPARNMATDEALLITAATRAVPVLRFYSWTEPAATFGYFQRLAEVESRTRLRPLIRRPTGGGIVPHDHDWTYSLTVPPSHAWYSLRAVESYRTMHQWVIDALSRVGVASELAPCCRKVAPGACFEGYEKFDVLWHGRKIAGAAQRRNTAGLLIQGSVQPPPSPGSTASPDPSILTDFRSSRTPYFDAWKRAMAAVAPPPFFREPPARFDPSNHPEFEARISDLLRVKYESPEFIALR